MVAHHWVHSPPIISNLRIALTLIWTIFDNKIKPIELALCVVYTHNLIDHSIPNENPTYDTIRMIYDPPTASQWPTKKPSKATSPTSKGALIEILARSDGLLF